MSDIQQVSKEFLKDRIDDSDTIIIDVRLNWATSQLMISNARYEDPAQVATWADNYPKDKALILYCSTPDEKTSADVAAQLAEKGFTDVSILKGGWRMWESANFPTHDKLTDTRPKGVVTGILNT